MEELQERVAELEQELEETQQNLDTASSIGQQMVARLQEIEEEVWFCSRFAHCCSPVLTLCSLLLTFDSYFAHV